MNEQTKSSKRRINHPEFFNYFSGNGIDIGCGRDPVSSKIYPNVISVKAWDLQDGDAQYLKGIDDATFDFVHSSHCLEHMVDPIVALNNWIRVCKPNGMIIITVPDEDLYEGSVWPSRFNRDHKWSFTTIAGSKLPKSIFVPDMLKQVNAKVIRYQLITEFYDLSKKGTDQTLGPAECAIEIILQK